MNRETYLIKIRNGLSLLSNEIQLSSAMNLLSSNVLAENFYKEFLNILFDWDLENANTMKHNIPGIDLLGKRTRIAIQVSSDISRRKIQSSLDRMPADEYAGYRFIMLGIANRLPRGIANHAYMHEECICFDPSEDIWDHSRLLSFANECPLERLEELAAFVDASFGEKKEKQFPVLSAPVPGDIEYYQGRDELLDEIAHKIWSQKPLYIWGEPGTGKTELVIRFGNRCRCRVFYTTFSKSIKETIARLRFVDAEQSADYTIQYATNMALLRKFDANTILIIDNFDPDGDLDPDVLRSEEEFAELINLDMKVIFTTRTDYGVGIHVPPLEQKNLLEMIYHFYPEQEQESLLCELIETVQYNTLAVELAARTLATCPGITLEGLLSDLKKCNLENDAYKGFYSEKDRNRTGSFRRRNLIGHIQHLYRLSRLTQEEQQVLSCAALLPLGGVHYSLFVKSFPLASKENGVNVDSYDEKTLTVSTKDYIQRFEILNGESLGGWLPMLLTRLDDGIMDEKSLYVDSSEVVDRMVQKGWIQHGKTNVIIKLHPMLLSAVMADPSLRPHQKNCMGFLQQLYYIAKPDESVTQDSEKAFYAEETVRILRNAQEMLEIPDAISESVRHSLHCNILNTAINYDNYGAKLAEKKDRRALDYHMIALKLFRDIQPGGQHLGICYDKIVDYYNGVAGDHRLALHYALLANDIFKALLPEYAEDYKISNLTVGRTYGCLGNYQKKLEYFMKNFEYDSQCLPKDHPSLAESCVKLSFAYRDIQDTAGQLDSLLKAYFIMEPLYQRRFTETYSVPEAKCLALWVNLLGGLNEAYLNMGDAEKAKHYLQMIYCDNLKEMLINAGFEVSW